MTPSSGEGSPTHVELYLRHQVVRRFLKSLCVKRFWSLHGRMEFHFRISSTSTAFAIPESILKVRSCSGWITRSWNRAVERYKESEPFHLRNRRKLRMVFRKVFQRQRQEVEVLLRSYVWQPQEWKGIKAREFEANEGVRLASIWLKRLVFSAFTSWEVYEFQNLECTNGQISSSCERDTILLWFFRW